jgi:hypothetical protein
MKLFPHKHACNEVTKVTKAISVTLVSSSPEHICQLRGRHEQVV